MSELKKPKLSSEAQKSLDDAEQQFKAFDENVKELTFDHMNKAPMREQEPQTKLSQHEIEKSKDIYLKPLRSLPPGVNPKTGEREKFNEKFRSQYEFAKEYVYFTAQNNEIIGEDIELWTKKFPGINCEFWKVPVNKPIWAPRYIAEQIKNKKYHYLVMDESHTGSDNKAEYKGKLVATKTNQRLDALPATKQKSIFMGDYSF